uniref:Uncharacterized protein n=1 Tax=Arundo donax TaxID=35708 RepID=A0A0A9SQL0_ARUDO
MRSVRRGTGKEAVLRWQRAGGHGRT